MAIFNSKLLNYQKAIFFRWAISCHHGMLKLHILFETEDQVDALDGGGRTARGPSFCSSIGCCLSCWGSMISIENPAIFR